MLKPRLLLTAIFLLGAFFGGLSVQRAPAQEDPNLLYMKVTSVKQDTGDVEMRFMMVPDNLRMVCKGDARSLSVGDYVHVYVGEPAPRIVKTEVTCEMVKWYIIGKK